MKRYGLKTNVILITRYDANIKRGQGLIRIGRRQQMSAVFNFARKKILVTGASQGIGYALSLALAQSGAEVYALSNVGKGLDDLCKKSSRITKITFDLCSSEEELREVLSPYQPFDCLVNNAGIAILEEFGKIMESTISNTFALNYKACLLLSQVVSLEMIKHKVQGSIVNVSSQCSLRPLWSHAVYCSSKAALDMATRCMAKELGAHGIRVNAVNPTVVMTEMGRQNWSDSQKASAMLDQMCIKRFAEVDDVINGVMFLLSDISAMTTGSTLAVDGGFTNM